MQAVVPTLVVLAAGIGSRFGGGVKQLSPVGPSGELLIDYSIHDALQAGFRRFIFILRRDIFNDFHQVIGNRLESVFSSVGAEWEYVFQDASDLPEGFSCPDGRTKPWGTGHAIFACRDVLHEPFAVINADDYYGKDAYQKAIHFLSNPLSADCYGLIGYRLGNTLSENGTVTRGICIVQDGVLRAVTETHGIQTENGLISGEFGALSPEDTVSMNFWMFPGQFTAVLQEEFPRFLTAIQEPLTQEFVLPSIVGKRLTEGLCHVQVLHSDAKWYGMTYQADTAYVKEAFHWFTNEGFYLKDLYSDIGK